MYYVTAHTFSGRRLSTWVGPDLEALSRSVEKTHRRHRIVIVFTPNVVWIPCEKHRDSEGPIRIDHCSCEVRA